MERREFVGLMVGATALASPALAQVAAGGRSGKLPKVTGPITGGKHGKPYSNYVGDLSAIGMIEEEYFLTGDATRFQPVGRLGEDGKWTIEPIGTAPYRTRILVYRPRDPAKFNGTVIVGWNNVTLGHEDTAGGAGDRRHVLLMSHEARKNAVIAGFAIVGVTPQAIGINGSPIKPEGMKTWDPERYGSLSHPGDSASYDIFAQAGKMVGPNRPKMGPDPMGGLNVRRMIATGGSQSAQRLLAYANGVHPLDPVFDGILSIVHPGSHPGFNDVMLDFAKWEDGLKTMTGYGKSSIRNDLSIPFMILNSETETEMYHPVRQPDTDRFRYWEVPGTAHAGGMHPLRLGQNVTSEAATHAGLRASEVSYGPTLEAAFVHMHRWIQGGSPPPAQKRIEVSGTPPKIVRDEFGNAMGGVRLPELDVPTATYRGFATAPGLATIGGVTEPFSPERLKQLYPTKAVYERKFEAAARKAEKAGVITPPRLDEYINQVKAQKLY